ncbi:MAG: EamA family transporter [Oscillospiraceae bacterium]|nr:EamA family transporter [Oscillospiraceae bacterium]
MKYEYLPGMLLLLSSVFLASIAQILLKRSASRQYTEKIREYLNPLVIGGYGIMLGTTVLSILALRWIPLCMSAGLDACGQIFVPLLSWFLLREKINKKKWLGIFVIIIGILIFFF